MEENAICKIWREAFNEDDGYINFFIKEGLPLGHQLFCGPASHPLATLTLFPITFEQEGVSYPGFYLYALGTLYAERRKGYGKALIKKAEQYAIETGCRFILLQPTPPSHEPSSLPASASRHDLFAYYGQLGYNGLVYRSFIEYSRTALCAQFASNKSLTDIFNLSAPLEKEVHIYDRFIWSDQLRAYMRKECLYRGGAVVADAFCYPQVDANGSFLEIKEFRADNGLFSQVIPHVLKVFPNIERFRFYGKAVQLEKAFALVRFLDLDLEKRYDPRRAYFALGLD